MPRLNALVIGGTGFIGRTLSYHLLSEGYAVTVVSRSLPDVSFIGSGIKALQADVSKPGMWQNALPEFDLIINLSGVSIFRRWNNQGKREIIDSRISTTSNIVEALRKNPGSVKHLFSVSGVGYYGFHVDDILSENDPAGSDFIADVAAQWEKTLQPVTGMGIRLVICRFGHVLGMGGGALPKLVKLSRLCLGGYWGSGNQWISWIHEIDLVRALLFLIDAHHIKGPVNITSPHPVRNRELMQSIGRITKRYPLMPFIPSFMLKVMLGQFSTVFLNGQRVTPGVLDGNGFVFNFPSIDDALRDLLTNDHSG